MDRLAVLGHLAGLWGPTYRWWPGSKTLRELGRPFWREAVPGTEGFPAPPMAKGSCYDFGTGPPP